MFTECFEVLTWDAFRNRYSAQLGVRGGERRARRRARASVRRPGPPARRPTRHARPTIAPCSAQDSDRRGLPGRLHRVHPRRLAPQLHQQTRQARAAGRLGERLVEPVAQRAQSRPAAAPGPLLAEPDQTAQHLEMRLGAALGGPRGAQRLQQRPDVQQVGRLLLGRLRDAGARVPPGRDEALGLQGAQRLADGDPGDPVAPGEQLLGQPAAGLKVPEMMSSRIAVHTAVRGNPQTEPPPLSAVETPPQPRERIR